MASTKPLILVTGGTGLQGGSVIRFLQQDGGFRIRTITRDPTKDSAIKLRNNGVEVVKADFEDVASLTKAMEGAYGVFAMTDFWEDMDVNREVRQGKHLVDAAKAAGVQHFVWSTLDNTEGLNVPHWRSKARVDDYLKLSGVPRTSLYTAFYFENFVNMPVCKVQKDSSGILTADWPLFITDGPIGMYAVQDTGAFVLAAFKNPDRWLNQDMRIQTEVTTPRKFFKLLENATGKSIKVVETDAEKFEKARSLPNVEDLWTNMKWFYMNDGVPNRDMKGTHEIYPEVTRFEDWVKANAEKLIA